MWHKLYNFGHHFMVICEFKRFSIGVFSNWVSLSRVNVIDSTWHSWIIDIFQETSFVFDMDTSKMLSFFIRFAGRRVFPFSCLFFVWNNLLENPARMKPNISWNFQIFLYLHTIREIRFKWKENVSCTHICLFMVFSTNKSFQFSELNS